MKKLNVRLFRLVGHSKGQFFSIVAIVAAALSVYVLFNMTMVNIKQSVDDYYALTNVNDIQVQLVKAPESALRKLKRIEGVRDVQGRISFDVPLNVEDKDEKVRIRMISLPSEGDVINKLYRLDSGTEPPGDNEAIVLQQFADARGIKTGDIIAPSVSGREYSLAVSGIAASPEFIYLMENEQALLPNPDKFGVVFVSEAFARSAYGYGGNYSEFLITIDDGARIDDIADRIDEVLAPYGVKRIVKLKDQLSNNVLTQKMDGIDKVSKVLPVMFLMVGAIIIVIMLSRIVSNDRISIGMLKALGYSNFNILGHYTKYAVAIGVTGSAIGIISGILLSGPLSQVFVSYFNIPFVYVKVYASYVVSALVLTTIFCVTSGLIGARTVLSIMPADSMRPESPKSGKRIFLERITAIWQRISFSWKIVIRNIVRTKRRFLFLVLGLSLAYAINTVPLYMGSMMPTLFSLQYGEYQKMDFTVDFSRPMNEHAIGDLKHLVSTNGIEPKAEYPFELENGWHKKTVSIVAIPSDTTFYSFFDVNGDTVHPTPGNIMLTETLAAMLHVGKGDKVVIRNFIPGKKDVELTVGSIVKQYLGSNAYMEIGTMQSLLLDEQMITGVLVGSGDDVKGKLEDVNGISAVRSSGDIQNSFLEYVDTMVVAINAYMLFGGILGFAIVYNSTVIGISERRMEFASLRVMGFDKSDIFYIITRENMILAAFAILLGIPLGIGMINVMAKSFSSDILTFPVIYQPAIFIQAALATFLFVVIAQLAARRKIYSMDFIEALKSRIS